MAKRKIDATFELGLAQIATARGRVNPTVHLFNSKPGTGVRCWVTVDPRRLVPTTATAPTCGKCIALTCDHKEI